MKTRMILLAACVLLSGVHEATGQTNYYNQTKTFHMDGYTYQCDTDASYI